MTATYFEQLLDDLRTKPGPGMRAFDLDAMREGMSDVVDLPGDVTCEPVDANGVSCEWISTPNCNPDHSLLYLHGGGYVAGTAAWRRPYAITLSRATGCRVLNVDYRLAPEHPFPAAITDCINAYRWMREADGGSTSTFIAGDSAGGGLTLATLITLRDNGEPLPDGAITLSAYTDLTHSGESMHTRAAVDPILCPAVMQGFAETYLGRVSAKNPYASPLFADLSKLPPLLMQVGDSEILLDDTTRFAIAARQAGVDVQLQIYPEMIHVFQRHDPHLPQAVEANARIGQFVREKLAVPSSL